MFQLKLPKGLSKTETVLRRVAEALEKRTKKYVKDANGDYKSVRVIPSADRETIGVSIHTKNDLAAVRKQFARKKRIKLQILYSKKLYDVYTKPILT